MNKFFLILLVILFILSGASAQDINYPAAITPAGISNPASSPMPALAQVSSAAETSTDTLQTQVYTPFEPQPVILDVSNLVGSRIVAYYGSPNSKMMGILGRFPIDVLGQKLEDCAKQYEFTNDGKKVIPAFYIIFGTCQPGGEIACLSRDLVERYIRFAQQKGYIVILDHQIGKYSISQAMARILPYLKYPNVQLALDPEWRTLTPMKNIGSISAEELNLAQKIMQEYMLSNRITGNRLLVVHQFNYVMIKNRDRVKSDYNPVILVHTQDGFGPPQLKIDTYAFNAIATNMPVKGFKLFYRSGYKGAGYDDPLMKPAEVLKLKPEPFLIMYQ